MVWFVRFRIPSWKRRENMWKSWYTATVRLRILRERSGSCGSCRITGVYRRTRGHAQRAEAQIPVDNDFANLSGAELKEAIAESIRSKEDNLVGKMASQGTTPRQLTDLIGSLCDLTSGSGDKGTPIILIQGYFDNFTTE